MAENHVEQAKGFFERAWAIDPKDERVLCGLGMCEWRKENTINAYRYFVDALAVSPDCQIAILQLIPCASALGKYDDLERALRRYVEVLTADGQLEVELDVDPQVRLAPDEQIEVFRIVQEGLGNARRHAGASHVDVSISQRGGRRVVTVSDDGVGFDETSFVEGQGVANMRSRAEAIDGALTLRTQRGRGTAIEVVLRLA